ncbi:uncharacterized protein LOC114281610 [Camellia sinensis]|uniref:uncharacterized protein LOC114281610 n=1 Tax=Camellia sinensis TaxID=4442 RepID=UPI001036BAF6|nr:uncharacterized protein LOC114281610 [Camellia sinensis]
MSVTILSQHQEVDLKTVVKIIHYPYTRKRRMWNVQIHYPLCLADEPLPQILYHPGKANTITDALTRKSIGKLSCSLTGQSELLCDLERNEIAIVLHEQRRTLAAISAQLAIIEQIREKQLENEFLKKIFDEIFLKPKPRFVIEDGVLKFHNRLCVPDYFDLRKCVMTEAHNSKFAMHPENTKMCHDLKQNFWWPRMNKGIADFVARCLHCQQVKGMDSIWVNVDRLTKSTQFLPVKSLYNADKLANLYVNEIVKLHGVPVSIVSDKDPKFTFKILAKFIASFGN